MQNKTKRTVRKRNEKNRKKLRNWNEHMEIDKTKRSMSDISKDDHGDLVTTFQKTLQSK